MRIVCISDTHGQHGSLQLPVGDVLVHAGDFMRGGEDSLRDFADWLNGQDFEHKLLIAGNNEPLFERRPEEAQEILARHCPGVRYLQDTGCEIGGLTFWGSPWQPRFVGSFNLADQGELADKWQQIPDDTDVLITHTPPRGMLDRTSRGREVGCPDLAPSVRERVKPRLHIFGHIHDSHGEHKEGGVHYMNASSVLSDYSGVHPPIVVQL